MAYGKDVEGSRPPHWMRSMEEKYQRLHAKIADQALKFAQSRNSVTVRLRELHQKNYNTGISTDFDSCTKSHRKTSEHSTLKPVSQNTGSKQHPILDCPLVSKDIDSMNKKRPRTQVAVTSKLGNPTSAHGNVHDTTRAIDDVAARRSSSALASVRIPSDGASPATVEHGSNQLSTSSYSHDKFQVVDVTERDGSDIESGTKNANDLPSNSTHVTTHIEDNDQSIEPGNSESPGIHNGKELRETNNSENITTHKIPTAGMTTFKETTNKNTHEDSFTRRHTRVPGTLSSKKKQHSKSATNGHCGRLKESHNHLRVFARMSMEAQHAIGETLKEMTSAHDIQNDTDFNETLRPQNSEIISPEVRGVNENLECWDKNLPDTIASRVESGPKTINSSGSNNIRSDTEDLGVIDKPYYKDKSYLTKSSDPVICDNVSDGLSFLKHHSQKGPQSERHGASHHDRFLSYPAPLPAIRQMGDWAHPEDAPFEITSPEFDARFCETSIFQRENCETPSTDYIRQQAIEKCRLWLDHQLGKL